jgi:DNA-binding response OmpR family regulator
MVGAGWQGLALARDRLPDVVLLDVLMARRNGFEVLSAARGRAKNRDDTSATCDRVGCPPGWGRLLLG